MAVPKELPNQSWQRLGQIVPQRKEWKTCPQSFTNSLGTFRLKAFSLTGNYNRYCYLRIKYQLGTVPAYSRWFRYYPSASPFLWTPQLNANFVQVPKAIEIGDFGSQKYLYPWEKPEPIKWSLLVEMLV